MPSGGAFNLTRFIQALGLKGVDAQPGLDMRTVTGQVVVGDATAVTPVFVPPLAAVGGRIQPVAGQFPQVRIICRSPGGLDLVGLRISASATGAYRWSVESPAGAPMVRTLANFDFGSAPIVSIGTDQTAVGALYGFVEPNQRVPSSSALILDGLIRLNLGDAFSVEFDTVNTTIGWSAIIAENVAPNA